MRTGLLAAILAATTILAGCQTNSRDQILQSSASAVQLRSFQTRTFDTADRTQTLRTVIATLQDLGFVVDKADATLGSVSGTKLDGYALRMTVTVRPSGAEQTMVRANAEYNAEAVEDPAPYQRFFEALEKAMFLTAHEVEG
ncbi:hypothetical protein [Geminicoccus roseus]|uniref:hypothetical protein n=1 Tax=Geminicoccus roseus TaxID=404900 RepID=UPI000418B440|nr:hypothetical protein [Geminicoccus roseus]